MKWSINKKTSRLSALVLMGCLGITPAAFAGYYAPSNVMSFAAKGASDNTMFSDKTLPLQSLSTTGPGLPPYGVGRAYNTQFANNGMAGCGVGYPMMQAIYKNAPQGSDYSANYVALNVYSHLMGYDPNAPAWGSSSGEGDVKGYVTFAPGQLGYPYRQYLRSMPALYPAYEGLYDDGLSCGRWVSANTSSSVCQDQSGPSVAGASKACTLPAAQTYNSTPLMGYVFDSCEDNNGWCRDDDAHIDIDQAVVNDNYSLKWNFIANPYYTNPNAPANLKDVWLAWNGAGVSKYWSYLVVANLQDGISMLQYNVGTHAQPIWINSHFLAGGNDVTWSDSSSNGQVWELQPMGSVAQDIYTMTDPTYEVRLFDVNGYPVKNGQIYQFDLNTTLANAATFPDDSSQLFYRGGVSASPGTSIAVAPTGTASLTLKGTNSAVSLSQIKPVLIDNNGFSYSPNSCSGNSCTFNNLPVNTAFTLYGVYENDVSNDLVVRDIQKLVVNQSGFTSGSGASTVSVDSSKWDFTTQYTGAVTVPVDLGASAATSVNANLQALFVPSNTSMLTASTQGCFLNNYYVQAGKVPTPTTCYLYYTEHHNGDFNSSAIPTMNFTLQLPEYVGADAGSDLQLASGNNASVVVQGYNPVNNPLVVPQNLPTVTYQVSSNSNRSVFLMLDSRSDAACLTGLSAVNVTVGSTTQSLTLQQLDQPVVINIPFNGGAAAAVSGIATMKAGAPNCRVNLGSASVTPGTDVVEMVELNTLATAPTPPPPPVQKQGVAVIATADSASCLNQSDRLSFGAVPPVAYTVSTSQTKIGLPVGNYPVSDQPFKVPGGICQVKPTTVAVVANVYTNLALSYHFTPGTSLSCSAVANVVTSNGWNGCNVTFDVTNTGASNISAVALRWNGTNNAMQPWGGVAVASAAGQVTATLPLYNPIAAGATVLGNSKGWGMTIQDGAVCSGLASAAIQCQGS